MSNTQSELLAELKESELNLVQTLLAEGIGKRRTATQRADFMRSQIQRIADRQRALIARIEGRAV
jgi:aconitase B